MWRVTAVVCALLLLAGCGSGGDTPTPSPTDSTAAEQQFLAAVAPLYPNPTPDADRVRFGRATCDRLDQGLPKDRLIEATAAGGFGAEDGARLVAAAVDAFCPKYR